MADVVVTGRRSEIAAVLVALSRHGTATLEWAQEVRGVNPNQREKIMETVTKQPKVKAEKAEKAIEPFVVPSDLTESRIGSTVRKFIRHTQQFEKVETAVITCGTQTLTVSLPSSKCSAVVTNGGGAK